MQLSTFANWILVVLFILALAAMLWTAWKKTPTTSTLIGCFLAFAALAMVDATLLVTQTHHLP